MSMKISSVDVWVVDLVNRPGMLARVLEVLSAAGANLEFVVARRASANTSRTFLAPIIGSRQARAAADVGLMKAAGMHVLRIESADKPGLGARMTRALADAGLNLRGLSAAAIGKKSVTYIAFSTESERKLAQTRLKRLSRGIK